MTRAGRAGDGPIVDIHNYLVLHTPAGPMRVDATWPLPMKARGLPVNEEFVWGRDMTLACDPIDHRVVPDGGDPQAFKEQLLRQSAPAHELARREAFIAAAGRYGGPATSVERANYMNEGRPQGRR